MAEQWKNLYQELKAKFKLKADEPMARHTSFGVGGPADLFAVPDSREALLQLVSEVSGSNLPVTIIGSGTNLLVRDKGIRGLVISLKRMKETIETVNETTDTLLVKASAGIRLGSICRYTLDHGLKGMNFAAGIPGTLGGAVMMNAGTPLGSMSDVLEGLEIVNPDGTLIDLEKSKLIFSYRNLSFNPETGIDSKAVIVLSALLKMEKNDPGKLKAEYDLLMERRRATQPVTAKTAGCFFKNPDPKRPAGLLIDQAGLKGTRVGNAMVSPVHANYIVNIGGATAKEILALKSLVQERVFNQFGITLETEVRIEGE